MKLKNHKPHIKGEWETNKENVNMKGRKEKSRERKRLGKRGEVKGAQRENSGKGKRKGRGVKIVEGNLEEMVPPGWESAKGGNSGSKN